MAVIRPRNRVRSVRLAWTDRESSAAGVTVGSLEEGLAAGAVEAFKQDSHRRHS
jgi:hypothetical protein